jgi:RNA polymerase sigma-70 factor (ECF subfamily)
MLYVPATEQRAETPPQPATLGDVLYREKAKAVVPEREWVALVHSIAAGEELALHALYERTHRLVFTLIVRLTGNRETAEELTLDVFHDVWRRASRYDAANGTVIGWIMNQARSRAIDRLRFERRKKRVDTQREDAPLLMEGDASADWVGMKQQKSALRAAVMGLAPQEREVIEAAFFSGMTHAEIAEHLNQPLGTVKTRIRSGLHKLKFLLAAEPSKL